MYQQGYGQIAPQFAQQQDPIAAIFQQVAGGDGQVSAQELQQCLSSGCGFQFDIGVCAKLISMNDRQGDGQADLNEFRNIYNFVNSCRNTFVMRDSDRSGMLSPNEVAQCLAASGINVSPQVFQVLIKKFDKNNSGQIAMDGYIALSIALSTTKNVFTYYAQGNPQGQVTFNLDAFIGAVASII